MNAAVRGRECIITLLLAHSDILVNLVDNKGWSALMLAATHGYEGIITILLAHSEILVNLISNDGWSALMLAAGQGHEAAVRLLLDVPHINTAIKHVEDGRTATSIALANGHTEIAKLLREFELHRTALISTDLIVEGTAYPRQLALQELIDEEMSEAVGDQDELSGSSRGAKRSRGNGEDNLESSDDNVTAPPAPKRQRGAVVAED
ncbi:ankyrin repeat-containing domain protein, partial [Coprinopsis sp. MPI-PUGE-AT-0042]